MVKFKHTRILLLILFASLLLLGCKEKRIPEKDMVKIFADVFITDALVSTTEFNREFNNRDTIEYYKPIYSKLGYSTSQFENTLEFYLKNPTALDKVLDKVISELSKYETKNTREILRESRIAPMALKDNNLWKGRRYWNLPQIGKQETIPFEIAVVGLGIYSVSADVKIMPNDQSIDPVMEVWFITKGEEEKPDSLKVGYRSKSHIKDGITYSVTLASILKDTTVTHIVGHIINHKPKEGNWEKHSSVSDIWIKYTPFEKFKDHNKLLLKTDTLEYSKSNLTTNFLKL